MSAALLERLRETAEACEQSEAAFRRDSETRLQALTAQRVAAYRRWHLLQGMAAVAAGCETAADAEGAALDFALAETGWSEDDACYGEVRARLAATVAALAAAGDEAAADAVLAAMRDFEAWYRERLGNAFLDRLAAERGFLPVVDF